MIKFAAVCLILAVVGYGAVLLKRYVAHLPLFNVNVKSISLADPPAWAPDTLGAQIRRAMPEKANIFDKDLPRTVYEACRKLYWVESVESVKKAYPNRLELKLKLREPVAYVRHRGDRYLTDSRGTRLPNLYYRHVPGQPDKLDIKGLEGDPPEEGETWEDLEALLDGITTARDIAGSDICRKAEITTIDVSNLGGRKKPTESRIVLITAAQTRIYWGRSSRNPGYADLSTADKLQNLEKAWNESGGLERAEYVRVYSEKGKWSLKYRKTRPR